MNEVSLEKPTTSQPVQPSEPVKKPQPSYTYDYHKEKELYESRRKGKDTNGAVSQRSARAEQDDLSEELIAMTKQLKQNALALSQGLSSDMPLIEQTSNKLEGNADKMTTQRKQLNIFSSSSRATTCLTFSSIVIVFISWIILFMIIKLT